MRLLSTTAVALVLVASNASAQTSNDNQASNRVFGDEIIVTAQKKSENSQDVPIAISAFSGDALSDLGITETDQLGEFIPGLELSTSSGEGSQIIVFLRGAGLNDFNTNNAGPVGIYSDEVYISSPALTAFQFFDTERLEVLKGPQGTLYGRNTTGGAIKFVANKPTSEFELAAKASYGNFNTTSFDLAASGPLSDRVRVRGAISKQDSDGFMKNEIDPNNVTDENGTDTLAWRGFVDVDLSDNFTIRGNLHGASVKSESAKFQFIGLGPGGTGPLGVTQTPVDPFVGQFNRDNDIDLASLGGYVEAKLNLGNVEITSITAYDDLDRRLNEETDGSPLDILFIDYDVFSETFSQELRLAGNAGRFEWLLGGFYLTEDLTQEQSVDLFGSARPFFPLGVNIPGVTSMDPTPAFFARTRNEQEIDTFAIFGQTDFDVSDELTLTFGGRYTDEDRGFSAIGNIDEPALGGIIPVYDFQNRETSASEFSWRLGADYKPDDNLLLYASIARGFKSGGFNGGFLSLDPAEAAVQIEPFDPEFLTAYEIGVKSDLLDNNLRLNASVFYNDFEDLQVFTVVPTGGLPVLVLDNATTAKVKGIEVDATAYPVDGLVLNLTAAFIDSEIGALVVGANDFSGNKIANTPSTSVSGLARYDHALVGGGNLYTQGSFAYKSDLFFSTENLPFVGQDAYTLVNGRVGYKAANGHWGVAVYGNNLTDKTYLTNVSNQSDFGFLSNTLGTPRTYGVELTVDF